jgi:hypothetical protein
MNNSDIESILLANLYVVNCITKNNSKTEIARKYLTMIINKTLVERSKKTSSTKVYSFFGIF